MKIRTTYYFVFLFISAGIACTSSGNEDVGTSVQTAQTIIDKTIEASGGEKYLSSAIYFDFRDKSYVAKRDGGLYYYERIFNDSTGNIHDRLSNDGFIRNLDGEGMEVVDSMARKYSSSVNSVIYFALLPYGLNDAAVNKEWIGQSEIKDQKYYKIRVTFGQEGGGEDFQDEYVYWINQSTYTIDYFGYTYETDGGGVRFRTAYNAREVEGIRFQDYINFQPNENESSALSQYDSLYVGGLLEELSKIELKNIKVETDWKNNIK